MTKITTQAFIALLSVLHRCTKFRHQDLLFQNLVARFDPFHTMNEPLRTISTSIGTQSKLNKNIMLKKNKPKNHSRFHIYKHSGYTSQQPRSSIK